jgi:hypothetical protein
VDQASVAPRLRQRTDCRSWVVACEDPRRLPSGFVAKALIAVAPFVERFSRCAKLSRTRLAPSRGTYGAHSGSCAHVSRTHPRLRAGARRAKLGTSMRKVGRSAHTRGAERRCSYGSIQGGEGVLAGDDPRATIGALTPTQSDRCLVPPHLPRTINEREPGAEEDTLTDPMPGMPAESAAIAALGGVSSP